MKKIITTTFFFHLLSFTLQAQVAIGKENVSNNSVSLEFGDSENRGLVLPYIEDASKISENGTIIYDTSDFKVKYLKKGNWVDLSVNENGDEDLTIQGIGKIEQTTAKVAVGQNGDSDTKEGILVLTDTNRSMVLPKVESPHLNIINPSAGMIVYDTKARQLAVYNGTVWTFWKP
ncbi:hypothetical protein [Empedobacter tilapiae]|uniref:Uncharacterized protein n=1 Tax=Empedobacter tilapiae TaxID=2491114 RepID=A0A4Z1B9Z8_9FLAO|nr:hypothetical protein [Empedobacter tilapiae]TGN21870.1 hypothetical protein E4J94_16850 [Empedobacter tilapiae]